jgi:hypothetical protein
MFSGSTGFDCRDGAVRSVRNISLSSSVPFYRALQDSSGPALYTRTQVPARHGLQTDLRLLFHLETDRTGDRKRFTDTSQRQGTGGMLQSAGGGNTTETSRNIRPETPTSYNHVSTTRLGLSFSRRRIYRCPRRRGQYSGRS